jgi:hypothetical protein
VVVADALLGMANIDLLLLPTSYSNNLLIHMSTGTHILHAVPSLIPQTLFPPIAQRGPTYAPMTYKPGLILGSQLP